MGGGVYLDSQRKSRAFSILTLIPQGHKVLFPKLEVWGRSAAFSTWSESESTPEELVTFPAGSST